MKMIYFYAYQTHFYIARLEFFLSLEMYSVIIKIYVIGTEEGTVHQQNIDLIAQLLLLFQEDF